MSSETSFAFPQTFSRNLNTTFSRHKLGVSNPAHENKKYPGSLPGPSGGGVGGRPWQRCNQICQRT
jgi:hypothetical protein